jgi:hypothetical protein
MCAHFIMSYHVFILCQNGHPDITLSIVSSCSLHSQLLLSVSSFRIFFLQQLYRVSDPQLQLLYFLFLLSCPIGRTVP